MWAEEVEDDTGAVVWVVSQMVAPAVKFAEENGIDCVRFCHNHTFATTHEEKMVDPSYRKIPESVLKKKWWIRCIVKSQSQFCITPMPCTKAE
jgi:hypothetical protein